MIDRSNPNDQAMIGVLLDLQNKVDQNDKVGKTVEILGFHNVFDPRYKFFDFFGIRPARRKYIDHELEWYLSLDRSIDGHAGIENNKIWQYVASKDDKHEINSQYGYLVFSPENGVNGKCQFDLAKEQLLSDINTRQAVIHYSRPSIWNDYCENGKHDYICTFNTTFEIRNNELNLIVFMRSNSLFTGFVNDFAWQVYVYEQMKNDLEDAGLKLDYGKIYWHAASFHAYEEDFEDLKKITDEYLKDIQENGMIDRNEDDNVNSK